MRLFRCFLWVGMLGVAGAVPSVAQESDSYRLKQHVVNAGGVPAQGQVHTSVHFRLTLESIAGPVAHPRAAGDGYGVEGGFVPGLHPATEVTGLRFADGETLTWDGHPAAGTFRVYRDALDSFGLASGQCFGGEIAQPTADDEATPEPGTGFAYLVTVANTLGEEGTPGSSSSGLERVLATPCP